MPAMTKPTSPVASSFSAMGLGVKMPSRSTSWARPVDITRILSPLLRLPFITRTSDTTPT